MSERDPAVSGQGQPAERDAGSAPAAPSENDGLGLRGALVAGVLAIAGLSSLAFAQPIYDVLRRAPEFFAIRNLYLADLLALVTALAAGPTLALSAPAIAARFLRPSWTQSAIAVPIGLLAGLITLQAVGGPSATVALTVALSVWLGATWAYVRFKGVRSFALLLSVATVVVPALLVLDGDVRSSAARPKPVVEIDGADTGARAPIVLVVFDEWSLMSVLDSEGAIDRERLPNLAALADRATWYPNAMAAADTTEFALPAMLTGSRPAPGQLPTAAEHPVNLFTLLAPSHDIHASEPITALCPPQINLLATPRPPVGERFALLISDLSLVWLRLTLPPTWRELVPAVTHTWSGFGRERAQSAVPPPTDAPVPRAMFHLRNTDRAAQFRRFVDAIQPPKERPGLFFLHSLLPHVPWEYLPSGRRYRKPRSGVHGLKREAWEPTPWPALHHHKRYLLQVEFLDRLVGDLTARLKSVGLFERSLIVITADHGVAFRPGRQRRLVVLKDLDAGHLMDIASVPLLIKAPFQQTPETAEEPVSLTGLTARILDLAGADTGAAPLAEEPADGPTIVGKYAGEVQLATDRESWRRGRLAEQAELLGELNDPMAIGVRPDLHGRPVTELPVRTSDIEIEVENGWSWRHVDTSLDIAPVLVEGVFVTRPTPADLDVAVALNGELAATVRPHRGRDGSTRITAMLPEGRLRDGPNQVHIFLVNGADGDIELEQLTVVERAADPDGGSPVSRPPGKFELTWGDGRAEALIRRPLDAVNATRERIRITRRGAAGLTGFLDGSLGNGRLLSGWAADLHNPDGRLEIVAFLGGQQAWTGTTGLNRPDVAKRHGYKHLGSGFVVSPRLPPEPGQRSRRGLSRLIQREGVVAYAVSRRGIATRLNFSYRPIVRKRWGRETIPVSDGRVLQIAAVGSGFDGRVDVLAKRGRKTLIEGWAADVERHEASRQIIIYRDGEFLVALPAGRTRADVAEHYEDERLMAVGFSGRVPGTPDPATFAERHRVFAIALRGVAVELPIPEGDGAGRQRTLGTQPDVEPP